MSHAVFQALENVSSLSKKIPRDSSLGHGDIKEDNNLI